MPESLANWDETKFVKFMQKTLEEHPPGFLPQAAIDELEVVKLIVTDQLLFSKGAASNWLVFGQAGAPAYAGGASAYNTTTDYAPAVWKDALGIVHLRGAVKGITLGTAFATLSPGYRPSYAMRFAVDSNGAHGTLVVGADGTLTPTAGSATRFSLDGISFKP